MKLVLPYLCLVTDRNQCEGRSLVDVVEQAVSAGVNMVQLREKDLPASALYELGSRLREITRNRALLFINDRVDVALACGADGVQLGEDSLPLRAAREASHSRLLLSRSVHSVESAQEAHKAGADLLLLGTIFPSGSHPSGETGGLERVKGASFAVDIPVLAIGGINANNIGWVINAGASGAAVITAITRSPDPEGAASALASEMNNAWANIASLRVTKQI
ncbi:MAG: thiamine phosphate synthase [Chloroflexi bacterium]|nr:thiamine phosphate synthase [Chloroflexota bacterium]MDA1226379.1 thiamine phosphate synthase [Chloroflexota bacterium]